MSKSILEKDVHLHGKLIRLFRNCPKPSGWFAGVLDDDMLGYVNISGTCPNLVSKGVVLDVTANLVDGNFGEQYEAYSVSICVENQRALLAYLSGPMFPGIGPTTAKRLMQVYGDRLLDELAVNGAAVQKTCKLTDRQLQILQKGVLDSSKENQLQQKFPHLGAVWAARFVKAFRKDFTVGLREFESDPYSLLNVLDIPFSVVDTVAQADMKIQPRDERRVRCVYFRTLKKYMSNTGAMFVNLMDGKDTELFRGMFAKELGFPITDQFVSHWIVELSKLGLLHLEKFGDNVYVYHQVAWNAEMTILAECEYHMKGGALGSSFDEKAELWAAMAKAYISKMVRNGLCCISQEQKEAIYGIMKHSLSCLKGGPGCGKTSVMSILRKTWTAVTGGGVMMLAPTGRATKRLQDATEYDEVQTIARCLTMHRVHHDEDDKGKLYGVNDFGSPHFQNAPTTLIVVDEASMVNEMEAAALLVLFHNCHIVFVGDVNQLPPIEPGPFFHELIESGVIPVMELTENHRVDVPELGENADKILDGNTKLHLTNHFMMIPGDDESVVQTIVTEYQNYLHNGADFADILLMSAVNKGIGSVADLNARLQDLMNPAVSQVRKFMDTVRMREYIDKKGWTVPGVQCNGMCFRLYDRVMCVKNNPGQAWTKHKHQNPDEEKVKKGSGVFNGDTGVIIRYYFGDSWSTSPSLMVLLDDGRIVEIDVEDFREWVFGYCITIHKAQGSEAPFCMIVLPDRLASSWWAESHFLTRNLIYTAVTRAKSDVWLLGNPAVFANAVRYPHQYHNVLLGTHLNLKLQPYLMKKMMQAQEDGVV